MVNLQEIYRQGDASLSGYPSAWEWAWKTRNPAQQWREHGPRLCAAQVTC